MINLIDLSKKTILVTGASGGIGKETSVLLSRLGARVIMLGRNKEKLRNVHEMLEGQDHAFYPCDLKNIETIENLVLQLVDIHGPFDGLVYCAGVTAMRPLKMCHYSFIHDMMLINFYGFIELVRCISKKNNFNEGMSIVAMSSIASHKGMKSQMAYCASKAALDGAVRALSKELADKKIRINSIAPGNIKTRMYENYKDKTGKDIENEYLLGIGEPKDISPSIAFFLSDNSRIVTGTKLVIDSGRTA